MKSNDIAILRLSERYRIANEAKHDQTRQRRFELTFESRDLPNSLAARADPSDDGKCVEQLIIRLDRNPRQFRRAAALMRTAAKLPRKSPWLVKLLYAIARNGSDRKLTMQELGLSRMAYWRGFKKIFEIVSAQ